MEMFLERKVWSFEDIPQSPDPSALNGGCLILYILWQLE